MVSGPREIEFHVGLDDQATYACRLVRKAWRAGARVVITGAADRLALLDAVLWTFEPGEFIPHARLRAGERIGLVQARTPVWLAERPADAGPADVLINLGPACPDDLQPYARAIDLIGADPDDLQAGRERWRRYRADGHLPRDVRGQPAA